MGTEVTARNQRSADAADAADGAAIREIEIPETLPLLPLPDLVLFPYMIVPLVVGPEASVRAVEHALARDRLILAAAERRGTASEPQAPGSVYGQGVVASIMRMVRLPDQRLRILVQGLQRARIEPLAADDASFPRARVLPAGETAPAAPNRAGDATRRGKSDAGSDAERDVKALIRSVRAALDHIVALGRDLPQDVPLIASNLGDPGRLADLVASNLDLDVPEGQALLETPDPVDRLQRAFRILVRESEVLRIQQNISTEARGAIERTQREYFLRQQMKAIQHELGEGGELADEIERYREKVRLAGLTEEAASEAVRELARLERMHPDSVETSTIRSHLDWMVEMPWTTRTEDSLDLEEAARILDEDHFGLKQVKERILEHLAVRRLNPSTRSPILCLAGPPGVGKTSLGKSIARALGRRFVHLSLGGMHDEAEIRGHRRTYVGAMPGKILQSIRQAGTRNPVFMLDEVDKVGADFRGDPSSALLEVLDSEQNASFRDNYLGVPFDLSEVMFLATANVLDTIQPAFRDRMEVISIGGYTEDEKIAIAFRHLIPKQLASHGLESRGVEFLPDAVRTLIRGYTREAGLRNLERRVGGISRKLARAIASHRRVSLRITPRLVTRHLGRPDVLPETQLRKDLVGVATGLAFTPAGGELLFVEATAMKGRGTLTLTGQLGDVMRESAQAAVSYARAHAPDLGIDEDFFTRHDLHVHVPEGGMAKDGPSAGVTIAVAIASLATGHPVRRDIAMTGEMTLRGDILPVGGLEEKVLAAQRSGIRRVALPRPNLRDLEDLAPGVAAAMEFFPVRTVGEAFALAIPGLAPPDRRVRRGRA